MTTIETLQPILGEEVQDPSEETFLLFSSDIPSQNLGIINDKVPVLDLSIGDRDFSIKQSPSVLNSARAGGTTGAVVWKVTPRFAQWLASPTNLLFKHGLLSNESTVLELGAGIAGIVPVMLAPLVSKYIATDQVYALKLLQENITANSIALVGNRAQKTPRRVKVEPSSSNVLVRGLDWETDDVASFLSGCDAHRVDLVLAADCVYNYALIEPFVQCCVDACRMGKEDDGEGEGRQTVVLVAQQLRQPDVFEEWLEAFQKKFITWRLPEDELRNELGEGSGFVVHLGILR